MEINIHYYREMVRIRRFEQKAISLFEQGELPGFLHSCIGQEAVAVGVCSVLKKNDYIFTTHRGHGHVLAKGMDMREMFAELYAKSTGSNKGKGGSMHIMDTSVGVLGANGVVGAGIPIAVGTALSSQMQEDDRVTVVFFGDGASNTGAFHESINLAAIWNLPIIFVCENNKFSESTPIKNHQRVDRIVKRAEGYGIPGVFVNGMDVEEVVKVTSDAVNHARNGRGPSLIEADTYRFLGHYVGDQVEYRNKSEYATWLEKDPITVLEIDLKKQGILTENIQESILAEIDQEINDAVRFAKDSPNPSPEDALSHIYF
ncbi:thiamine pyrophosphate-dependent dehydrogenase E1 component subunit alpha [Neobacillus cucumis]|uniref:thiamine pyrophosphate-dependent dehydrogenase E1 component subunit alpha n=1 Tax=Neobacillus cucumis TaxID=1740721 RepID=UPI0018DF23F3|nr:thiamine pyrophosphate-dependent dehydrogenase E1 component subunit alpha [Neobacillus cucumis]MBI0579865.1 thiamine pyrophosphate-dependent dehydrogenase E1 component subunit alpha [Neobacillus cucumis]